MLRSGASVSSVWHVLAPLITIFVLGLSQPHVTAAQTCGTDYTIKEGETLAQIAARVYGNPAQWTVIFYANQDRLGTNESLLVPGLALRLPCIGVSPQSQPLPQIATTPAQSQTTSESAFVISA